MVLIDQLSNNNRTSEKLKVLLFCIQIYNWFKNRIILVDVIASLINNKFKTLFERIAIQMLVDPAKFEFFHSVSTGFNSLTSICFYILINRWLIKINY